MYDDTDLDYEYDDCVQHPSKAEAAGPRGRAWLRYLMNPSAYDYRPVRAEIETLPPAKPDPRGTKRCTIHPIAGPGTGGGE